MHTPRRLQCPAASPTHVPLLLKPPDSPETLTLKIMKNQLTIHQTHNPLAAALTRQARPLAWLAGACLLLAGASSASATTYYWAKTGSNTYGTASNWSPATTPGVNDTAVFNNTGVNGGTISKIGSAKSVTGVQFVNTGSTTISANTGSTQTWTIGTGGISIGSGAGAVTISQSGLPIAVSLSGSQSWTNSSGNTMNLGSGVATALSAAAAATLTLNGNFAFLAPVNNGAGTLTLAQSGGTVTLGAANTYSGSTTINGGTLVLGSGSSINSTSAIAIAAGGTLDVSAQGSPYTLPGSGLSAGGHGTAAGSTEAQIIGPAGGVVSLGANPVTLAWGGGLAGDTSSPCLVVSQGALALSGNVLTINGSKLGVGSYRLIQVGDGGTGSVTGSPNATPTGSAIDSALINVLSVDSGNVILTVSSSSSPLINTTALTGSLATTYGTASATPGSFNVSGISFTPDSGDLTVTPPGGFEVSLSAGSGYTTSLAVSYTGGALASTPVYVRLAATTSVGAHSGDIQVFGGSASPATVTLSSSTVSPLAVALSGSKTYDASTSIPAADLAVTNKVGSDDVTLSGSATLASANAGNQTISSVSGLTLGGAAAGNYTLAGFSGSVTVNAGASSVTTWPTASPSIRLGHPLSSASLSGGVGSPAGTFAWSDPASAPVALGTQSASVTFTPGDTNFGPTLGTASVVVTGGDGTWTMDDDGTWSNGGNWLNNDIADGAGATGTFTSDEQRNRTFNLESTSRTLGTLIWGQPTSVHIASSGGAVLILDNNGSPSQITVTTSGGKGFYIDVPIELKGPLHTSSLKMDSNVQLNLGNLTNTSAGPVTITNNGGGYANFFGVISDGSGARNIAVTQEAGTLKLSGANTYSGGTTVSAGTLTFSGSATQPSTGALAISGGATVNLNGSVSGDTWPKATVTGVGALNQPLSFSGFGLVSPQADMSGFGGVWTLSGAGLVTVQSPFVSPAAGATIHVGSGTTLYLGWYGTTVLGCNVELYGADDGEGFGQLRVENDNHQNGSVILKANSSMGSTSGVGTIGGVISDGGLAYGFTKVGAGTITLTRANTYTGATTVSQGTLALVGGSLASPVTVSSGASLGFTLGSPTTSTSSFDLSAGTIKITGTPTSGTYPLITSSTGITGTPTLDAPIAGFVLQVSGNALNLVQIGGGFSSWITGTFANGTVPAGLQGPNDDPDHDGISNLMEYAVAGQDPTVASATIGTFTGNTLSFTKRAGTSGLTYAIVQSSDLGVSVPWTEVPAGPSYVNDASTISYTLTPGSPVKNFIRLRVTQAP